MTTMEQSHPLDRTAMVKEEAPSHNIHEAGSDTRKRKLSEEGLDNTSKRIKSDEESRYAERRDLRKSPAPPLGFYDDPPRDAVDRRKSATQEEKKRGKRLFGGLLSTLSQTTGSSQQKRRLDIERRQQERLHKQRNDDDRERAEKLARVTKVRESEQIVFEEKVLRNKHEKRQALAKFIRTKSRPYIYYLPWKLTPDQEDQISDQKQEAKEAMERELRDFKVRQERHAEDHGRLVAPKVADEPGPRRHSNDHAAPRKPQTTVDAEQPTKVTDKEPATTHPHDHPHHHHDEADVLEEADEDMVIY